MSKKQMGFTLIEIVMVLVLLGILSAIAVPKYFDLRDQAEQKAMAATAAEYQARLNAGFADALLKNAVCSDARTAGIKEANKINADAGATYTVTPLKDDGTVKKTEADNLEVKRAADTALNRGANSKKFTIAIPTCNDDTPSSNSGSGTGQQGS